MNKDARLVKLVLIAFPLIAVAILVLLAEKFRSPIGQELTTSSSSASLTPVIPVFPPPTPYPKNYPQLSVSMDQIATFQDRYFMRGTLHQDDITRGSIESVDVSQMILSDSTGKPIPIEPLDYGADVVSSGVGFSFYTRGKGARGMLTLTVTTANFDFQQNRISSPGFNVDFGENPTENQEWSIGEDFNLAGRQVHLLSVRALMKDGNPFLEFTLTGAPDTRGVLISDKAIQAYSGGDFQTDFRGGQIITLLRYADGFPRGKHQFSFETVSFSAQGNWQVSFNPASIDKQPSSTKSEFQNACFADQNWVSREGLPAEIPAELSGTLLIENEIVGSGNISMAAIDLRGGEKHNILPYQPATFSPDGTMLLYYDWQEHQARTINLHGGEANNYPWSKGPSNRISWLNNTDFVAYDTDDGIYISHLDGTGLHKVSETDADTLLGGWLPDGQHLLISQKSYKKPMLLQVLDINNGETKDLFSYSDSYLIGAIPSPDGRKVLFDDFVAGTQQQGIFIASLDGSERHLIASFWHMLIGSYTWSPNGKWVIISVTDVIENGNEIFNYLVNIDSCQIIQLSNIDWAVRAWGENP